MNNLQSQLDKYMRLLWNWYGVDKEKSAYYSEKVAQLKQLLNAGEK